MAYIKRQDLLKQINELKKERNGLMGKLGGLTKELNYQKDMIAELRKPQIEQDEKYKELEKKVDGLFDVLHQICSMSAIARHNLDEKEIYGLYKGIMSTCIVALDVYGGYDDE